MQRRPFRGVMLDHCQPCAAVWLDGGELEALTYGLEAEWAELVAQGRREEQAERRRVVEVEGLCPRCQRALELVSVGGVELDRCRSCGGIFFDRAELARVLGRRRPGALKRWWARLRIGAH